MTFKEGEQCPACKDGKLVKRKGRYGEFLGCDMYRHTGCNFVGQIAKEDDNLEKQADEFLISNGISILKI